MKKLTPLFKGLILFFFATVLWTGAASAADWTFMVYMSADNDLEDYGIDDFLEMAEVGSDRRIDIVVQFDRIDGYDSRYGDWQTCKRFHITPGMTPVETNQVEDLGECNMGDPDSLTAFVNWGVAEYPADRYALVLWDHGGGWRSRRAAAETQLKTVKEVCWDDTDDGDPLNMQEVRTALASADAEMDLIGFDACLMGMIEVAYELRNSGAGIMVGSEASEPGGGWPYDTLLADLAANPSMRPDALGAAIVNRFGEYYGKIYDDVTLSAIDLTAIGSLGERISRFADTLQTDWTVPDKLDIQDAARSVMEGISAAVTAETHTDKYENSHGLAIYFPINESIAPDYDANVIDFPGDTLWDELLAEFSDSMNGSWVEAVRQQIRPYDYEASIDLFHFCDTISKIAPCDIYEAFSQSGLLLEWWAIISTLSVETWSFNDELYDNHYAKCLDSPDSGQDEVLISPKCGSPQSLSFLSRGNPVPGGGAPDTNFDLQVWLVKGEWDAGTVDDILLGLADDDWVETDAWAESVFDLSGYDGAYRIAFRYTDSGPGADVALDDICLVCGAHIFARAGADQTVAGGDEVILDGSGSRVANGEPAYKWEQTGGPSVTLANDGSAQASFTAPRAEGNSVALTFTLTVMDAEGRDITDSCTVTILPDAADAGEDQVVDSGDEVNLDGSGSRITNDAPVYQWKQTGGPPVALQDENTDYAYFTAPEVEKGSVTLTFMLTVTDSQGSTFTDTCDVIVLGAVNDPPVADAGEDQTVVTGDLVTLDAGGSTDPDDSIDYFEWYQLNDDMEVALSDDMAAQPTFTAPEVDGPGGVSLFFELYVEDMAGNYDADYCIVTVLPENKPPVADAGEDQTVTEGDLVTLDAGASSDPDDGIASCFWEQTDGPSVILSDDTLTKPSFIAPEVNGAGTALTFRLTVTDTFGKSSVDTVIVAVTPENEPPMADAGEDQVVTEGDIVTLDAAASTDPDDGIVSYLWEQTDGPSVPLSDSTSASPSFIAPVVDGAGAALTFRLTVTDSFGEWAVNTVIVTVTPENEPPLADAGGDQIVTEGDLVSLDASGSNDPDDNIASYSWEQTDGPVVTLSDNNSVQPTFTAPEVSEAGDSLTFSLTVTDTDGVETTDTCTVEVEAAVHPGTTSGGGCFIGSVFGMGECQ